MDGEVINFPKWKKNSTSLEKLQEVTQYAESRPAEVNDVIVIWADADGIRHFECESKLPIKDAVFMLELAKFDLLKEM